MDEVRQRRTYRALFTGTCIEIDGGHASTNKRTLAVHAAWFVAPFSRRVPEPDEARVAP